MITISTPIEKKREEFNYENTNEKKSVHIIFGIDDLFVEPMAICVLSLLYYNQELKFVIHVITTSIREQNKTRLRNLAKQNNIRIIIHFIDENIFRQFPSTLSYPSAIYNRLLIPMILNPRIDRALYLDADIMCFGDISKLFSLNIQ